MLEEPITDSAVKIADQFIRLANGRELFGMLLRRMLPNQLQIASTDGGVVRVRGDAQDSKRVGHGSDYPKGS